MTVACQQQMMEVVRAGSTRGDGINKLARFNVGGDTREAPRQRPQAIARTQESNEHLAETQREYTPLSSATLFVSIRIDV
jgi:hypothetical protein